MPTMEETFERACANLEIPGAVLLASNRDGSFYYSRAFGKRSVRSGADQSSLTLSTVMWIASCTKLLTSISCMQLVERGLLTLDSPIYAILPELKDKLLITGFKESGEPILEPHKNAITLRRLLSHSSGLAYDDTHPKLLKWREWTRKPKNAAGRVVERYSAPLAFEPGTSWSYGPGIDWAGKLVERVTGQSLEDYMKENLWGRVGVRDITFKVHEREDMKGRLADMSKRDPKDKSKAIRSNARLQFLDEKGSPVEDCMGGLGLFASPEAFFRVLCAVLTTDGDGRLLKRGSVEEFFRPQLTAESKKALRDSWTDSETYQEMGGMDKDWGLGGLLTLTDVKGGRRKGTMQWGGLPNLCWFVDREEGLCGFYAGQLTPPGDPRSTKLNELFEMTMYERMRDRPNRTKGFTKL